MALIPVGEVPCNDAPGRLGRSLPPKPPAWRYRACNHLDEMDRDRGPLVLALAGQAPTCCSTGGDASQLRKTGDHLGPLAGRKRMLVSHPMASGIRETPDRRRLSLLVSVPLAMAAVMYLGAQAVHAQDWASISGDDRRIFFYAPKLNDKIRRSRARITADYSTREEISTWSDRPSGKILSGIYLGELLGGYHYATKISLTKTPKRWNFFESRKIRIFDRYLSTGNNLGRVEFIIIKADNHYCVAFREYWGISGREFSSEGTALLHGYYCADENQKFSAEEARQVVRLLGVKGIGVPVRPPVD